MHRFTIQKGSLKYDFDIEDLKIVIGDDEAQYFDIMRYIENYFDKTKNSDYAINSNNRFSLLFDERTLNLKEWDYFNVTPFYNIGSDFKLGTKSLIFKYLQTFSGELEQSETFQTINILLNSFKEEFFDDEISIDFGDKKLQFLMNEFTSQMLFKELNPSVLCNAEDAGFYDLSYEDLILFQLKLIQKISDKNIDKNMFIVAYIPEITAKIKFSLIGLRNKGLFVLTWTNQVCDLTIDHYSLLSKKHYIDFANEEMIMDKMMDFPFHIELNEFLIKCKRNIENATHISSDSSLSVELFYWKI